MKLIGLLLAIATVLAFSIAAFLALASPAGAAECFPSIEAARAAIGPAQHIAWQGPRRHRSYFKGHRGEHVRCDEARIPLPRERVVRHEPEVRQTRAPVREKRQTAFKDPSVQAFGRVSARRLAEAPSHQAKVSMTTDTLTSSDRALISTPWIMSDEFNSVYERSYDLEGRLIASGAVSFGGME